MDASEVTGHTIRVTLTRLMSEKGAPSHNHSAAETLANTRHGDDLHSCSSDWRSSSVAVSLEICRWYGFPHSDRLLRRSRVRGNSKTEPVPLEGFESSLASSMGEKELLTRAMMPIYPLVSNCHRDRLEPVFTTKADHH